MFFGWLWKSLSALNSTFTTANLRGRQWSTDKLHTLQMSLIWDVQCRLFTAEAWSAKANGKNELFHFPKLWPNKIKLSLLLLPFITSTHTHTTVKSLRNQRGQDYSNITAKQDSIKRVSASNEAVCWCAEQKPPVNHKSRVWLTGLVNTEL